MKDQKAKIHRDDTIIAGKYWVIRAGSGMVTNIIAKNIHLYYDLVGDNLWNSGWKTIDG